MPQENIFLDTDAYNEFIRRQSYVDETHPNPPFIIFEPISTNSMESQSQNISHYNAAHIEILDNGGDEHMQETHKKSDLFEVHMKKIEKSDGKKIVVCNYCSKKFKWSNQEATTLIDNMSLISILPKLRGQR